MKGRYRNITFLAELAINILVFSISCAILVGVFANAWLLAKQNRQEIAAVNEVSALLETAQAKGIEGLPAGSPKEGGGRLLAYDESWQPTEEDAAFTVLLTTDESSTAGGRLQQIEAVCHNQKGQELCRLQTAVYLPGEGGRAA